MNYGKIFTGIMLVFIGFTFLAMSSFQASNIQYGGVIFIGPIPLVFGSSPAMASFALIFALIFFIFVMFVFWR